MLVWWGIVGSGGWRTGGQGCGGQVRPGSGAGRQGGGAGAEGKLGGAEGAGAEAK